MEKTEKYFKPVTECFSEDKGYQSFFSDEGMTNITQNASNTPSKSELNRIKVFRHIEVTQPTTAYRIHKELNMAYNTISYIVRDLIFAGVVSEKMKIGENNVAHKELTIPDKNSVEVANENN